LPTLGALPLITRHNHPESMETITDVRSRCSDDSTDALD
jgi:hypothetical protein